MLGDNQPTPYHLLYERDDTLVSDDSRARRHVGSLIFTYVNGHGLYNLSEYLDTELGIPGPIYASEQYAWQDFATEIDRKDFLSCISYVVAFMIRHRVPGIRPFINEVRRIFIERSLRYTIDDTGTVHPLVDESFEMARRSAVSTLSGEEYEAARTYIERVDADLTAEPPDGAAAIRNVFLAAENVFRQIDPGARNLNAKDMRKSISKLVAQVYNADGPEKTSARILVESFASWIDAAHFYRHEQNQTTPLNPPVEHYVALVSVGFSHVRWLAALRMAADRT